jgi:PKD repeat protein
VVTYNWDFGDGNTGTGVGPTHTYAAASTYTITLTVTDDDGAADTATTTCEVESAPEPSERPELRRYPSDLRFYAIEGEQNPPTQILKIENKGEGGKKNVADNPDNLGGGRSHRIDWPIV